MRSIIRIETQRLVLRTVTMSDISEVSKTWNLEKGDENRAVSLEKAKEAIEWMEDNHKRNEPRNLTHLCMAILRKESEEIIGWGGLDGGYGQSQDKQKNIIFYTFA